MARLGGRGRGGRRHAVYVRILQSWCEPCRGGRPLHRMGSSGRLLDEIWPEEGLDRRAHLLCCRAVAVVDEPRTLRAVRDVVMTSI